MIQRIQTIYLFIALALLIIFSILPVAVLTGTDYVLSYKITYFNYEKVSVPLSGTPLFISGIAALLNIITILIYKNRKKQYLLCIISVALLVCLQGLLFYQIIYLRNSGMSVSFKVSFIFPLVSAIVTYLAAGRIKKDEALVRSYERLR